jgi:hypothetical protein
MYILDVETLKVVMSQYNVSQQKLATMVCMRSPAVNHIVQGTREMTESQALLISYALDEYFRINRDLTLSEILKDCHDLGFIEDLDNLAITPGELYTKRKNPNSDLINRDEFNSAIHAMNTLINDLIKEVRGMKS